MDQSLELSILKIKDENLVLPWPTTSAQLQANGGKILEIKKENPMKIWPFSELYEAGQKKLEESLQFVNKSFAALMRSVNEIREQDFESSSEDVPRVMIPPVTPHTKKTKRTRARRGQPRVDKRSTSSSWMKLSDNNAEDIGQSEILPDKAVAKKSKKVKITRSSRMKSSDANCNEIFVEGDQKLMSVKTRKKKNVKMKIIESETTTPNIKLSMQKNDVEGDWNSNMNMLEPHSKSPDNELQESKASQENPKPVSPNFEKDKTSEAVDQTIQQNIIPASPEPTTKKEIDTEQKVLTSPEFMEVENEIPGIKQLISLHETLIESHQKSALAPLSSRKVSEDQNDTDKNTASPDFKQDEKELNDVKKSRSMEEQIFSCKKKNPVINIAKLRMPELSLNTIQGSPQVPLTLTFDASDEEDIADSIEEMTEGEPEQRKSKRQQNIVSDTIKGTPVGTVSSDALCIPRRSLDFNLRLSDSASDMETSIHEAAIATGDMNFDEQEPSTVSLGLEQDSKHENQGRMLEITSTTTSQSVSLCSSSANTVVLDSEDQSSMSQESCSSETEEQEKTPPRRSTRASKRPSLLTGLASKRLSTPAKLAAKRIAANKKAYENSLSVPNTVDTEDSSDESSESKRPKITKPVPVFRKKLAIPSRLPMSTSSQRVMPRTKRNLTDVESGGLLSPSQPRLKYMKCASPLCHDKTKSKKLPIQKSRNTILNRSTASSRARRTPGPLTPSRTRGFAFATISGPNICFTSPSRPVNLTADVQSFIKRNTPQKVDYEEQLAEKKQQLEEKQRRERELKKKKEEEKQRKIEEKKRKRSMRLREAAEKREQRLREEKEKQLKQVEQWEKRIADADKTKVLRKKEETAKVKKIKKKQVEAEEQRRREEEERIRKIKQQEQEKEQRLQEHKFLKEQEAAMKRQAEQKKILEKQKMDKLKEEKEIAEQLRKEEEETMKREEEEKSKRMKAEAANKLRLQKLEKEAEKKRKIQEEIDKKNAETARIEQERIEKEKEAQLKLKEEALRRQEEAIRRKEKEEARKRKQQEAKALAEEKALRKKEEEIARAEELRRRREEMRKEDEMKREEERLRREQEKKKLDDEKRRKKEIAEKEKLRKIQESNERLKKLEEEHKREKDKLKAMNPATFNQSLHHTPGPSNHNSTYTLDENAAPIGPIFNNTMDVGAGPSRLNSTYTSENAVPSGAVYNETMNESAGPSGHNSTYTLEKNTSHLHESPQSYDMTPNRKGKVFAPSTEENYNIDDIASDDSTDDDENPRKVVPRWSKGPMLRSQIIKQYYNPPDLKITFRNALEEMKLEKIFGGSKSRYFKRTSSAHWDSPIMPPGHISFTDQCRGFDDLDD
uniref:inner centromere protein A-like isoform X1 n=1 Tax=Styela clava TaxID=7725 RepID=UPI00193996E7|nr:inner centromere protein A-like isoform X1 [Styela clava]